MDDAYARLSRIIAEEVGRPGLVIGPATELEDIPGWDSVTLASVILAVEAEFAIAVSRQQVQDLHRGSDLALLCAGAGHG